MFQKKTRKDEAEKLFIMGWTRVPIQITMGAHIGTPTRKGTQK